MNEQLTTLREIQKRLRPLAARISVTVGDDVGTGTGEIPLDDETSVVQVVLAESDVVAVFLVADHEWRDPDQVMVSEIVTWIKDELALREEETRRAQEQLEAKAEKTRGRKARVPFAELTGPQQRLVEQLRQKAAGEWLTYYHHALVKVHQRKAMLIRLYNKGWLERRANPERVGQQEMAWLYDDYWQYRLPDEEDTNA